MCLSRQNVKLTKSLAVFRGMAGMPVEFTVTNLKATEIGCLQVEFATLGVSRNLNMLLALDFRNGKTNILVATDVAARGLGKS